MTCSKRENAISKGTRKQFLMSIFLLGILALAAGIRSERDLTRIDFSQLDAENAKYASTLVLFVDKFDAQTERLIKESNSALDIVNKDLPDLEIKLLIVEGKMDHRDFERLNVQVLPSVRFYEGKIAQSFDGRAYAKQISAFIKRNHNLRAKKVSAILRSLDQYNNLEESKEPFVVYCGQESDPSFAVYEKLAKDRMQLYYHCFDPEFCTRLAAIQARKINDMIKTTEKQVTLNQSEKEAWLARERKVILETMEQLDAEGKKVLQEKLDSLKAPSNEMRQVEEVDEELWESFRLKEPAVFVTYKPNDKYVRLAVGSSEIELSKAIRSATIDNFYNDFDKLYDYAYDIKFKTFLFISVSPHKHPETEFPCTEIKRLAELKKFDDPDVKFACLGKKDTAGLGIDIIDRNPKGHELYYVAYQDLDGKKEVSISRPFKYKLENPLASDVEKFYNEVRAGKVPKYYFEETEIPAKRLKDPVKYLIRNNFKSWVEENIAERAVVVIVAFARSKSTRELVDMLRKMLKTASEVMACGDFDSSYNQVDDFIEDADDTTLLIWKKGSKFTKPIKVLFPNGWNQLRSSLKAHIPEISKLTKEESNYSHSHEKTSTEPDSKTDL